MQEKEEDPKYFTLFGLNFPVYKQKLIRYTILVYLAMAVLLTVSVFFLQYEMTNADFPGGLIAGFLGAYLLTIITD